MTYYNSAELAAICEKVRNETIEECAKLFDGSVGRISPSHVADMIRALRKPTQEQT